MNSKLNPCPSRNQTANAPVNLFSYMLTTVNLDNRLIDDGNDPVDSLRITTPHFFPHSKKTNL